jgi:hypothetical protein
MAEMREQMNCIMEFVTTMSQKNDLQVDTSGVALARAKTIKAAGAKIGLR